MKQERRHSDEVRWSGWMAAAQRGDQAAYKRLLTELGEAVEAYLVARFGRLRGLEDMVQECLLAIHHARHTYDPARAFRPWVFTVVRHKAIDLLRKTRQEDKSPGGIVPPEEVGKEDTVDAELDSERLLEAMKPEQREAVVLTQYLGMTAAEAADSLAISESALKARLRRGLSAAREVADDEV